MKPLLQYRQMAMAACDLSRNLGGGGRGSPSLLASRQAVVAAVLRAHAGDVLLSASVHVGKKATI